MWRFRLIPHDKKFHDDFRVFADQLRHGARLLEQMLAPEQPLIERASELKEVEHQCDFLTHEIIQRLNRTSATSMDREDIHFLARALDDVIDEIENVAALITLYRIDRIRDGARELSQVILAQTEEIHAAIQSLDRPKAILVGTIAINRLENDADRIHKDAVGLLFDRETDPIVVMKWKEVLDALERATDRCEGVANLLENVAVKHG